ncbi:MAG: MBL fold metallo-hydrolase [Armatimonadota bacterium]|nr:MBL fold metallo-hydrolase [Armatimonadota bacterium]
MTRPSVVRRLVAPNPSPMTGAGTNTYVVGDPDVAVIDPGPDLAGHLDAIVAAARGRVTRILVTHDHPDHAEAAGPLSARTGAPVLTWAAGLRDGDVVHTGGTRLVAVHTPGHTRDHVCFLLVEDAALFSGDLVMSGSTVVIAPPEGDMAAYLASLERLRTMPLTRIYPGHGDPIDAPGQIITQYLHHRRLRERQILEALADRPARIPDLVARIYTEVSPALHGLAAQSVFAHLLKLKAEGAVIGSDMNSEWRRV